MPPPPDMLEHAKQFFQDPAKALGTFIAAVGYGGWLLLKLILKDPTKVWQKKTASIPPTPLPEKLEKRVDQLEYQLELEQLRIRAERADADKVEIQRAYGVLEHDLDQTASALWRARQELQERDQHHQRELDQVRAEWTETLAKLRFDHAAELDQERLLREEEKRVHARALARIEAEKQGIMTRLAYHDSQLEMKIERLSTTLDQPAEKVEFPEERKSRGDFRIPETKRPPPLKKKPR